MCLCSARASEFARRACSLVVCACMVVVQWCWCGVCVSRGWPFCQIAIENVEAIFSGSGPGSHQTHAHLSGRGAARPSRVLGHQSGGAPDAQWHGKGGGIRKFRPFFIAPHLRLAMAAIFSESKTRFARRHLASRSVFVWQL